MSRRDDLARMEDMLAAAQRATAAIQGRTQGDLERDHIWSLGLLKSLEIIGEAAARVKPETRARFPQVPWGVIVATRNRIVHGYFEIDYEQVWKALTEDLPPRISLLEDAIARERAPRG